MTIQNLPPLNEELLAQIRIQAEPLKEPGGLIAFHHGGTLTTAFISKADGISRVVSWSSYGPLTTKEAEQEIEQTISTPPQAVPIN